MDRRKFISQAGLAASGLALSHSGFAFPLRNTDRKIHIGIVGGNFGSGFFFHEDPNCIVEAVSDLIPERKEKLMRIYKCTKGYNSLTELLTDKKIDAVFVATPAPDHFNHVTQVLKAGKHVLLAVPAVLTLEQCNGLRETVRRTGLTYMMAETSYYRQNTISVRDFYKKGAFGTIFSAAAEYNHPGLETLYFENGKPTWRHGLPPMKYPTHCTSFLISVTGERLTRVSCLGWGDDSPILKKNKFNNPFWNETAFFQTNRNTPFRVEVNWKGALRNAERAEWRGTKMSFYSGQSESDEEIIVHAGNEIKKDDGGFDYKESTVEVYKPVMWWDTDLLPSPLRHQSGHGGSHTFITHEFIDALINNRKPAIDIYEALAYTAPGIVAHESALKNGESMKIPSFD